MRLCCWDKEAAMLEILILTGVGVWLILALRSCFRGGGCSGSCGGSCANCSRHCGRSH